MQEINSNNKNSLIFKNISFKVKKKNEELIILDNVSANVYSGELLGILGPSGAGKTTLLNVLTHSAYGGKSSGKITYNGKEITPKFLRENCYIVNQQDYHWPFLTCEETIEYAINLYMKKNTSEEVKNLKNKIIKQVGLESCRETKVGNEFFKGLSGGQKRRLSIAIALVKESSVIFLDEPTSGLDAAAASNVISELNKLSKELNLIIVTTIHQPSSKIFFDFDNVMILSEGRMAYFDSPHKCKSYLESIDKFVPENYNPAEYFLDLINSDFESKENVNQVIDLWKSQEINNLYDRNENNFKYEKKNNWLSNNIKFMFKRHSYLAYKDPIIYISRAVIFFITNIYFSLVYYQSRYRHQDQVLNRMWLTVWFIGVPANMGVVTVYACNNEFNSILKEVRNGMITPFSYLISKTLLEIPIMLIFGFVALGVSAYGISNYYLPNIMILISIWSLSIYCWEAIAQVMSLSFKNPLLGMMLFMGIWFSSFLYGGFLIPGEDMIWPFKIFFYILPLKYTIRSMIYTEFIDSKYDNCAKYDDEEICFDKNGKDVLENMNKIYPLFSSDNTLQNDILIILGLTILFKLVYFGLLLTSNKYSNIVTNK